MRLRTVAYLGTGILIAIGLGALTAWRVGRPGSSELESWIGRYLTRALHDHLNARIEFRDLDYQYPLSVRLRNFRLHTLDTTLLQVDQLDLQLAEVPRAGEPVRIQEISATRPVVTLDVADSGDLIGWSTLFNSRNTTETTAEGFKLSDFLEIRRAAINECTIVYQPRDGSPLRLNGVAAMIETPGFAGQGGAHKLRVRVERNHLFELTLRGEVNLDTAQLTLSPAVLTGSIDAAGHQILPPAVHEILRRHDLAGNFRICVNGVISASDLSRSVLDLEGRVTNARFSNGGSLVSAPRVELRGAFAADQWNANFSADTFGAQIEGKLAGVGGWRGGMEFSAQFGALRLNDLLSALPAGLQERWCRYGPVGTVSGTLLGELETWDFQNVTLDADVSAEKVDFVFRGANTVASQVAFRYRQHPEQRNGILSSSRAWLAAGDSSSSATNIRIEFSHSQAGTDTRVAAMLGNGNLELQYRSHPELDEGEVWVGEVRSVPCEPATNLVHLLLLPEQNLPVKMAGILSGTFFYVDRPERSGEGVFDGRVTEGSLRWKELHIKVPACQISVDVSPQEVNWRGQCQVFGGTFDHTGTAQTKDARRTNLSWDARALQIEEVVTTFGGSSPSPAYGRLWSRGKLEFDWKDWRNSIQATGTAQASDARLFRAPILHELTDVLGIAPALVGITDRDTGRARFRITRDAVLLDQFDISNVALAARGDGRIGFDGALELGISVDMFPAMFRLLGPLGEVARGLRDRVISYRVRGQLDNPRFESRLLRSAN